MRVQKFSNRDVSDERAMEMTKEELKRAIDIADQVLWETRGTHWIRDYAWLKDERARLKRALEAAEGAFLNQSAA
jgi:hypothetical protein